MLFAHHSRINRSHYSILSLFWPALLALNSFLPCYAQTKFYELGLKEYNARHYKEAAVLFNNYVSPQLKADLPLSSQLPELTNKPLFVYSILYEAACLEQCANFTDAAMIYKILAERYPDNSVGLEAKKALAHPKIAKVISEKFPDTVRSANLDYLPKATWVPFKRYNNVMLVEGSINGKKTNMLFDTGAAGCLFSLAQLKSLGIAPPTGAPTAMVTGIGTQKQTPAWIAHVDLKLGNILRRQFPVQVNDNPLNFPLVGTNFFEGMEYTIDHDAGIIKFKTLASESPSPFSKFTITVDSSSHYVFNVPFTEMNRAIIVMAKVGGKDCQMMLDTGTDICLFTNSQLRSLGVMPRYTGKSLGCKGAAGDMRAPVCVFEKAEFGPIKGPLVCVVTDQANLPLPLLGQNYLNDWQLTVDHSSHLIKLIRK